MIPGESSLRDAAKSPLLDPPNVHDAHVELAFLGANMGGWKQKLAMARDFKFLSQVLVPGGRAYIPLGVAILYIPGIYLLYTPQFGFGINHVYILLFVDDIL